MAHAQEQAQEKRPGKNMLWGGRFTGLSFCLLLPICLVMLGARDFFGEREGRGVQCEGTLLMR